MNFQIDFDTDASAHNPTTGDTVDSLAAAGWRSIGAQGGGEFTNNTGGPITACYLKCNRVDDKFLITRGSPGTLFKTIWLKNDSREVYFMGANIPANSKFWMQVPRNPESDIKACNACVASPPGNDPACLNACPFAGQMFASDPPAPPATEWTKIL